MLRKVKINNKKLVAIMLILVMIFSFLFMMLKGEGVRADSYRYTYDGNNIDTNKYPGYKEKLDEIKKVHPNWNITIMETGLDWNQVIIAEKSFSSPSSPYSLIQSKGGAWVCTDCGMKGYDNGSWYHASEAAIKYYMDPRNWMDPESSAILQFLQISGVVDVKDEDIYNAIKGTFLDREEKGMENAKAINSASKENKANPFYVVARILQEQGTNGGGTWRMKDGDNYYYNLFNIGATGSGSSNIIANALATAKRNGWDSIEKSISGGIKTLFSDYINQKQDTIYLNKFDVETYKGLYHQYMQNIEAPKSEAALFYSKIKDTGILDQPLTLVIPVFNNMPNLISVSPETLGETEPINIRVKEGHSDINVREGRSTSSKRVTTIKDSSVVVLSVERYGDGWHRIVLEDGTTGYIFFNTNYFEQINDITNCNEQVINIGQDVNLRAGPGLSQTSITEISYGQEMTRIDNSGRYNIDGKIWDRVRLSDGRQGFISREFLKLVSEIDNVFKVRAEGGLFLRSSPNGENIRLLPDGSTVTRTEIGTELIRNFYWDKVTTPDGAIGYVARAYLRDKNGNVPSGDTNNKPNEGQPNKPDENDKPTTEIKVKKDDNKKIIYLEPNVNEKILKSEFGNNVTITKKDGSKIEDGVVGTGYIIKIEDVSYNVSKLGDINGDGYVDTGDTYMIKKIIIEKRKLDDELLKFAANVKQDEFIDTGDSYILKRKILNMTNLSFID